MDNERLTQRIRSLLDKTVANGCTEAEALAAAEKAAQLMREANLSHADLEFDEQSARCTTRGQSAEKDLWSVIGNCTNTACVLNCKPAGDFLVFIGRDPGPQIAAYLWTVCDRAIKKAVREFKKGTFYRRRRSLATKRKAVSDFKHGMVMRLSARLLRLFQDVRDERRLLEAAERRDQLFPCLATIKQRSTETRFDDAVWSGSRAGEGVNLSHGVNGSTDRKRLSGAA